MSASATFFKLFPPPAFLTMPHAGLDVSDDGIRCVRYDGRARARRIGLADGLDFPPGLMDGGDIKDEKEFAARLKEFSQKHRLNRVKVSIPEEKAYLFQTEVPAISDRKSLAQNIESKLEENVPLTASDALFSYELMPPVAGAIGTAHASVSVVPRIYIEHYIEILKGIDVVPVAFEVSPKAIARAVISPDSNDTKVIVHSMRDKLGIYIVSGGVVCFTSTVGAGSPAGEPPTAEALALLSREIARVSAYWTSRDPDRPIVEAVVVGRGAASFEDACRRIGFETPLPVRLGDVWQNAIDIERSIPSVSRADSMAYVVAAGLAFDLGDNS